MCPAGVVVSMLSVTDRKPAPAAAIRSMMCSTSLSERDSQSPCFAPSPVRDHGKGVRLSPIADRGWRTGQRDMIDA